MTFKEFFKRNKGIYETTTLGEIRFTNAVETTYAYSLQLPSQLIEEEGMELIVQLNSHRDTVGTALDDILPRLKTIQTKIKPFFISEIATGEMFASIDECYKSLIPELSFNRLLLNSTKEQRLEAALNLDSIALFQKRDVFNVAATYALGYTSEILFMLDQQLNIYHISLNETDSSFKNHHIEISNLPFDETTIAILEKANVNWKENPKMTTYIYKMVENSRQLL